MGSKRFVNEFIGGNFVCFPNKGVETVGRGSKFVPRILSYSGGSLISWSQPVITLNLILTPSSKSIQNPILMSFSLPSPGFSPKMGNEGEKGTERCGIPTQDSGTPSLVCRNFVVEEERFPRLLSQPSPNGLSQGGDS